MGLLNLQGGQIYGEKIVTFTWCSNDMFHYMLKRCICYTRKFKSPIGHPVLLFLGGAKVKIKPNYQAKLGRRGESTNSNLLVGKGGQAKPVSNSRTLLKGFFLASLSVLFLLFLFPQEKGFRGHTHPPTPPLREKKNVARGF